MTHTHTQTDAHADTRTPENRTPGNGMSENRPPGNRPPDARPSVTRADDTRTAVNRPAADHPPTDRTATERAAADRAAATADPAAVDVTTAGLPAWLDPVAEAARSVRPHQLSRFLPPESGAGRQSAVLVLFGEGARGPELLLMERSGTLRSHAGQPSFPGGALDPEDGDQATTGPLRAALREAEEETGLDPRGVQLFGVLPRLYIPVSSFVVTPVLGWWRAPSPVGVVDPAETARVFTVPVADLTDPANRAMAVHPSGHSGPAFLVESALVWGFTAGVIDRILHYAGWERPWDRARQVPLDWRA
ncbi:NUDIX hydrolase [Streptomyces bacillaris]|uniref:NUDIX hydrolase n=1 Tax=Streptomyces bacillaris TaxID=68179 RepID=UPI003664CDAC